MRENQKAESALAAQVMGSGVHYPILTGVCGCLPKEIKPSSYRCSQEECGLQLFTFFPKIPHLRTSIS